MRSVGGGVDVVGVNPPPLLRYQAKVLASYPAARISGRPSPSTSPTPTGYAPPRFASTTRVMKPPAPSFSYQKTSLVVEIRRDEVDQAVAIEVGRCCGVRFTERVVDHLLCEAERAGHDAGWVVAGAGSGDRDGHACKIGIELTVGSDIREAVLPSEAQVRRVREGSIGGRARAPFDTSSTRTACSGSKSGSLSLFQHPIRRVYDELGALRRLVVVVAATGGRFGWFTSRCRRARPGSVRAIGCARRR